MGQAFAQSDIGKNVKKSVKFKEDDEPKTDNIHLSINSQDKL
jgi:hypothetical protein